MIQIRFDDAKLAGNLIREKSLITLMRSVISKRIGKCRKLISKANKSNNSKEKLINLRIKVDKFKMFVRETNISW